MNISLGLKAQMAEQGYVTGEEAARIAGWEATRMTKRLRAGDLPGERRNGTWWVKRADLDAFLATWETVKVARRDERYAQEKAVRAANGHARLEHAHPFVPRTGNGPATWAEMHPPEYRERRAPMPQAPDCCGRCGKRCVTIGGLCVDCLWGKT